MKERYEKKTKIESNLFPQVLNFYYIFDQMVKHNVPAGKPIINHDRERNVSFYLWRDNH